MASRGSFGVGPQGPTGQSTGAAGGDLGGNYPNPTLQPTAGVESIIVANSLDEFAPAAANVNMNSHKITGLANGTVSTDAAAFGQLPTTLPPNGSATGDLTGTYPAPTLAATSNVNSVIRANSLDQMTAPSAAVPMNNQKFTGLANGSASADSATFGQIPVTLPPSGSASGDLTGTYPSPTVTKVNGVTVSGTPTAGNNIVSTGTTTASWQPNTLSATGLISGGMLSANLSNPTAFDITAGVGYIADYTTSPTNPTVTRVTISAQTVTLSGAELTRNESWWVCNSSGTITSLATKPTPAQRRSSIQLGVTAFVGGALVAVVSVPAYLPQSINTVLDLTASLGPFVISGGAITANGANLQLNMAAANIYNTNYFYGTSVTSPSISNSIAETPLAFYYETQLASSQIPATAIDVSHYDVGGVITAIPGGSNVSTVQRIYLFPSGVVGGQVVIQYGQTTYATLAAANASIGSNTSFITSPDIPGGQGTLLAYLCVTKTATDLSNAAQAIIVPAPQFSRQ